MEKHWAIPDDVSPGNFPANVRISVCNPHLIYSTWFLMLDARRDCETCKHYFEKKHMGGWVEMRIVS